MSNPYTPKVGHFISVGLRFVPYKPAIDVRVEDVIEANEQPDEVRMAKLFESSIKANHNKVHGLGIPTKPSKYVRMVCRSRSGRAITFTLNGSLTIELINECVPPRLKLVK